MNNTKILLIIAAIMGGIFILFPLLPTCTACVESRAGR